MGSRSGPNFCSQCGASLSSSDAFCSQCGTSVGGAAGTSAGNAAGTSIGSSASGMAGQSDFRRRIEDLTVEGWEVKHDYGDRVVMIDRGFGSVGVHVLLLLFTGGLGNIPYAWYHYSMGADRLELRADGTHRYVSGGDGANDDGADDTIGTAGNVAVSFFFGLIGLAILGGVSSFPAFFMGVSSLLLALYALPPVRERLHERQSITTFGSVRGTDEKVVNEPDTPCTACSRPVDEGVARTFHETVYVAGFPLSRDEQGTNHYCRSCAQGDPFTDEGADAEEPETEFEF